LPCRRSTGRCRKRSSWSPTSRCCCTTAASPKSTVENRLPAVYSYPQFLAKGGLLSYATHRPELFRHAAAYVDKVLKGTPAGELPVERSTRFHLVVNLAAARATGLDVPALILARADEVIE